MTGTDVALFEPPAELPALPPGREADPFEGWTDKEVTRHAYREITGEDPFTGGTEATAPATKRVSTTTTPASTPSGTAPSSVAGAPDPVAVGKALAAHGISIDPVAVNALVKTEAGRQALGARLLLAANPVQGLAHLVEEFGGGQVVLAAATPAQAEQWSQRQQLAVTAVAQSRLEAFQGAKVDGKPRHPDFHNVRYQMAAVMAKATAEGRSVSLEEAYVAAGGRIEQPAKAKTTAPAQGSVKADVLAAHARLQSAA